MAGKRRVGRPALGTGTLVKGQLAMSRTLISRQVLANTVFNTISGLQSGAVDVDTANAIFHGAQQLHQLSVTPNGIVFR